DEVDGAADLLLRCEIDGEVVQEARTEDLLFRPADIVAYLSTILTLEPGDLVSTGTPAGVGAGRQPPVFLEPGQVVRTTIEGLGGMVAVPLAGNALAMSLPGGAAWAAAWAFGQLRRRGADRLLAGWVVLVAGALASFALFLLLVAGALVAGSKGPVASLRPLALALAAIPLAVAVVVVVDRRVAVVRRALGAL